MRSTATITRLIPTMLAALIFTMAGLLLSGRADAGREVLSDVDCVVEPSIVASVGSAVPGVIESVRFDRSDFVSKGMILAELESGVEKAALELALRVAGMSTAVELRELNADFGARTHNRNRKLFQNASISSQNMDQVKTESRIARLQVKQEEENRQLAKLEAARARATLERRIVRSPFDGSITKRFKSLGEYVEGEPVFEIAQLDPLFVEVILPLDQLGVINNSMRGNVALTVPGFENEVLEATVLRIDSVADAASGTYGVRLELPNPELKVPAGVRCQIDFVAD